MGPDSPQVTSGPPLRHPIPRLPLCLQGAAQMVSAGKLDVLAHMLQLSVSDEMG